MKFKSDVQLEALNNATTDTDKFLVSDSSTVKYRTGAEVLSDIGGQAALTNPITGTGTTNYVSKFTGTGTLGNSLIYDNGTNVGIGTTNPTYKTSIVSTNTGAINTVMTLWNAAGSIGTGARLLLQTSTSDNQYGASIAAVNEQGAPSFQNACLVFQTMNNTSGFSNLSERMRISSIGNVGIGTTNPSSKLDLGTSGALKITEPGITEVYVEGTGVRLKNIYTGGGWARSILTYENSAGTDYFQLGGLGSGQTFTYAFIGPAYNMPWQVWRPDGKVGIGTGNPLAALHVRVPNSNTLTNALTLSQANAAGTDDGTFSISVDATNNLVNLVSTGTNLGGFTFNNAGNESMRITSTGNVGIGITAPTQRLDVTGNIKISNNNSLMWRNAANNADIAVLQLTNTNKLNIGTTSSSVPSVIALHTNSTERFRINADGNVGIGTASPTTKLHIVDTSFSVSPSVRVTHDVGFINQSIEVMGSAFDGGGIVSVDENANLIFKRGGSESMRIDGEGKVGIGTSSPDASAILHLQSTTKGFLPPVMKDSQRAAISSPAQGLMIFNSDTGRINVFDGIDWRTVAWA